MTPRRKYFRSNGTLMMHFPIEERDVLIDVARNQGAPVDSTDPSSRNCLQRWAHSVVWAHVRRTIEERKGLQPSITRRAP